MIEKKIRENGEHFCILVCYFFDAKWNQSRCRSRWENLDRGQYRFQPIKFLNLVVPSPCETQPYNNTEYPVRRVFFSALRMWKKKLATHKLLHRLKEANKKINKWLIQATKQICMISSSWDVLLVMWGSSHVSEHKSYQMRQSGSNHYIFWTGVGRWGWIIWNKQFLHSKNCPKKNILQGRGRHWEKIKQVLSTYIILIFDVIAQAIALQEKSCTT